MVKNPIHASDPACATTPPLVLSASLFAVAGFETDRGQAQMSAWLFTSPGLMGDVDYPALAPSAYWHGGPTASSIGGLANVSPDGRVLVFTFPGGPPDGPCAVDYTGVIAESPHAVAIAVQSSPGRTLAGPDSCHLIDHTRLVTVRLASPLGARVVVDASGAAVQVCPGTIPIGC